MNILFLTPYTANPVTGGVSVVCHYLYRYLTGRGHGVTMLAGRKHVEPPNGDFVFLPDSRELLSGANRAFIDGVVDRHGIQLVFNHTCLDPEWSVVVRYLKRKGLKVVSVYHNSPFGIYGIRKYPWLCRIGNTAARRVLDAAIRRLFYVKYHRLISMQAEYSDRVVMLSGKFAPEYLYFAGKRHAHKITAMPNPLTIEGGGCAGAKENVVLFVGRLAPEKGLPYLLEVWKILETSHPGWRLQVVGDGSERAAAERMAARLGLKRCTFYGRQKPEPFYAKAKVFCMTSLFEGFGLVLIEAMAFGVVPLAFNSYANVGDIISDGRDGYIIPPFDVEAYAAKVARLMDDEALRSRMAVAGMGKSKTFTLDEIGARWERLFDEVVDGYGNTVNNKS